MEKLDQIMFIPCVHRRVEPLQTSEPVFKVTQPGVITSWSAAQRLSVEFANIWPGLIFVSIGSFWTLVNENSLYNYRDFLLYILYI